MWWRCTLSFRGFSGRPRGAANVLIAVECDEEFGGLDGGVLTVRSVGDVYVRAANNV
jgi:hypothetical protein